MRSFPFFLYLCFGYLYLYLHLIGFLVSALSEVPKCLWEMWGHWHWDWNWPPGRLSRRVQWDEDGDDEEDVDKEDVGVDAEYVEDVAIDTETGTDHQGDSLKEYNEMRMMLMRRILMGRM